MEWGKMMDLEKQDNVVMPMEEAKPLEEQEKEKLLEGAAKLDFDRLCSTVALQTHHGKWRIGGAQEGGVEFGGVLRMWEGELLDCFDDRVVAFQSTCCPCYRFGKNMQRAGFGSCFLQGTVFFILSLCAILSIISFIVTSHRHFLYLALVFIITVGLYLGFFRIRMKKKLNIKDSDSYLDDCIYHLICPCCTLCQESRTLEINNVQDGTWHGRGDTVCIAGFSEEYKPLFEMDPPSVISIQSSDRCQI